MMPFFAHVDLFSEYRRLFYAIEHGEFIANSHRLVTYYIEMIFAGIAKLLVPSNPASFYLPDPSKATASVQDYFLFLQDPYIHRYLFIFKLPYFLFDLGVAAIIWRFVDDLRMRKIALLLWLFNPLTLFATYIFGRFEVISLFFLALTAYQLKQHRIILASILFAICLHCREINLVHTPFFLIALIDFKDPWFRNLIKLAVCSVIIFVIYLVPEKLIALVGDPNIFVDPDINHQSDTINKLFSLGYSWFFPVIIGLSLTAIYLWEIGSRSHAERFVVGAALVLSVYFAFNVHSVHYASWLVIFPILAMQFNKDVALPFLALFLVWTVLWLLKTDGGVFTPFLAAPLSMEFVGVGHFPSYFNSTLSSPDFTLHRAIQVMRSLFAVVMFFFCYRLIRNRSVT